MRKTRAPIKMLPPVEELRRLFEYEPETGVIRWRVHRGTKAAGSVAGTMHKDGYLLIGISSVSRVYWLAHRIIWKMMTGEEPVGQVDHVDGDPRNNRWDNFRMASHGQNIQNAPLRKDNTSGVKGVHWDKRHRKWNVVVTANGTSSRLGRFRSIDEAAWVAAEARLRMHGEFARYT
jgi:hypothetical protein